MPWPFVSRTAYDLALAELADAKARADHWQRVAFDAVKPPVPVLPPKAAPDPVAAAIRDVSGSNGALRTHLAHFAREERAKGTPAPEIERQVRDWSATRQTPREERLEREEAHAVVADILDG